MKMMNYTGKGIGVAILDTGISPHPDFGNRICAFLILFHINRLLMMIMGMELM